MNKSHVYLLCAICMFLLAAPLHGQTGCTDSPENPTIVLALVGSAGGLFSTMRARKARRDRSN